MNSSLRLLGIVLASGLVACASTPTGIPVRMTDLPPEMPTAEQMQRGVGTLSFAGGGSGKDASYGMWRIGGPQVDLTYSGNGVWTGTLSGRAMRLTISPGKIEGAGVNLLLYQDGETVTLRGIWFQRQIWITMTPTTISGKVAANAPGFEIKRSEPGKWSGLWGPGVAVFLTFKGEAVQYPTVPTPQFHLALLAVLL